MEVADRWYPERTELVDSRCGLPGASDCARHGTRLQSRCGGAGLCVGHLATRCRFFQ
ncbi:hypothetical protein BC567DRAFT_225350 [Phyllosticta citribraziliensis]